MPPQRYSPEGKAHSRSLECDSGQAFQTQSSDSNRVVPISAGVHSLVFQVDPTSGGLVCNPVQSQTATVSPVPDPTAWAVDALSLQWDQLACVSDPPGNLKVGGSGLSQDDPHFPRMAKHALVLGPSEPVSSDSLQTPSGARPGDSTLQRGTTQESQQPQSSCLAPRISAIQEHGFSDEVAARIEAAQRSSTRAI